MASPSDRSFAIIRETTPGVLPGTGTLNRLDYIAGSMPYFTADQISSQTVSQSRASAGTRRVNLRVEGSLRAHLHRDPAIDLLLESALGGTFAANALNAGAADQSLAIEQRLPEGAGVLFQRFLGCQVSGMALEVSYDGNAEVGFDLVGMSRQTATSATTLTYAGPATTAKLTGLDVSGITVGALSVPNGDFVSLALSCRHTKEPQGGFGSASARGVGTSGFREVTLSLRFYRANFDPEAVLTDTGHNVQFQIGSGADGYVFRLPRAFPSIPRDEDEGSSALVVVDFRAAWDSVLNTDFRITRTT